MNLCSHAWNGADEARPRSDDCLLRRAAMGSGNGCAAPHRQHCGVERGGGPRVEHDGGSRLAGGLRVPSAHRRAQGGARTAQSMAWSRQEQSSAQRCRGTTYWPSWPRETRTTSSASASPTSCAPPARAPKRCSRFSSAARKRSRDRVARGSRTATADHADSPGKVADGMSTDYDTRTGHGAGQAGCRHCRPP